MAYVAARVHEIDELLEMVGLSQVRRRSVGEFSKGMSRRLGLAQALINDPELLILDEPTSGLDPIGTRQVKDLLVDLGRRGTTILLSSHLLADVEDVCDRMVILYGGRIHAEGATSELLADQQRTVIRTEALDDDTVGEVEGVLRRRGLAIDSVERPRQRLEDLFMGIVEKAQSEAEETSGALQGGSTAAFLGGDGEAGKEGSSLIDALESDTPAPESRVVERRASAGRGTKGTEAADDSVLEDLLEEKVEDHQGSEKPSTDAPQKPEGHDSSMIDGLLGDDHSEDRNS